MTEPVEPAKGVEEYQDSECFWEDPSSSTDSIECPQPPTWVVIMTKADEQTFVTLVSCSEHLGEAADVLRSTSPGTQQFLLRKVPA